MEKESPQHTIVLKLGEEGGPIIEFHNVSVLDMMAGVEFLRREVEKALFQIEVQQNGRRAIQPVGAIPGLKGDS